MSDVVLTRAVYPVLRRAVLGFCLAALVLAPLALGLLAVETAPRVVDPGPPDAAAAARTRDLAESLQALIETEAAAGSWSVSEAELDAVLASAQRLSPGLFGTARVAPDGVAVDVSAGPPLMPGGLWANLHLALAPSEHGLEIAAARIGRLPLPPALARAGLVLALDRLLGDGLGSAAVAGVTAVRVAPPSLTVALDFGEGGSDFFDRLRSRAHAAAGPDARARVYHQLWFLDRMARSGELPRHGSVLPYFAQVIGVAERSGGDPLQEMRAALYALALYCGDADFGQAIAVTVPAHMRERQNRCGPTTLAGRHDLKRHFVISAGLYAASSGRASFGMGELKELLDSNEGGSGFSFDDIAADLAGARFAAAFLAAPPADWPAMLASIDDDAALLPALDGLPSGLGEAEFRRRYGDVDSPAYAAMVEEIRARVDALPLYAGAPAD
jgi:hypothetical protein